MIGGRWTLSGLALLTGLLYGLSFPDPGWFPLAWIALVPFLLALSRVGPLGGGLLAALAAVAGTLVGCHWVVATFVREYGFTSLPAVLFLAGISLVASLPYLLAGAGMAFLIGRRWNLWAVISCALVWTAMEWLRVECFPRFPWMLLGASQARWPIVVQLADLTGVYGVSFMLVLFSGLVTFAIVHRKDLRRLVTAAGLGLAVLGMTLTYGGLRLSQYRDPVNEEGGLRVAVVQPSIPQRQHWDPARIPDNIQRHLQLSTEALRDRPRLLVWPEAAATFDIRTDRRYLPQLLPSLAARSTHLLVGTPYVEGGPAPTGAAGAGGRRMYNSALLFNPFGRIVGRYDKRELLPFGEYYPAWVKALESLWSTLRQHMGNIEISPGRQHDPMQIEGIGMTTLICHEILFPGLVRRSVADQRGFLLNISNDAWFGTSGAVRQHFELGLLRTVENRRPLVRAANTGISAFVDAAGRVTDSLEVERVGWLQARVHPRPGRSVYGRYGDVFAILCLGLVVVMVGMDLFRKLRAGINKRQEEA